MSHWEGISEFVAVAETNSFTRAATKLATSVAQISRRVSSLENRLAVKLLHRTTRKVSLTEAGQLYYEHCRPLVEGLENAEFAIHQMQSSPKGLLRITAPVTYGEQQLAPLITSFMLLHPQLELDLVLTNQKLDLIEQGLDLAIRLGKLEDSGLMARRLSERQLYVCASPGYIAQHGEPYSLSELTQHQCLIGSQDHWRFKEQGRSRSVRVQGKMRCNSGPALLDAAIRGIGLVQLPGYYVNPHLNAGTLIEVMPQYRDDKEGIWALYPANRHLSPKVRMLIDFLIEQFSTTK
ncbi:LysR substrate-binding domain-containing protein [Thaumasiovibrio sp. DFM-14]|uniref:LysR substrate-binding domain-containing protein n=1 Tax=Thaumasiovibrio sp. DFM-14 TaxID=3384792 RepID=UPI0039A0227C